MYRVINKQLVHRFLSSDLIPHLTKGRGVIQIASKQPHTPLPGCSCKYWQRVSAASLHLSSVREVGKLKNTKKKLIKKVTFKKSAKSQWEVISIRPAMTINEVAQAMGKDTDHVFEALLYIPNTDRYDEADKVIDDVNIIKQILDKSGFRWKMEGKKKQLTKEVVDITKSFSEQDKDIVMVKRPPVVTIMGHVDHGKTTLLDALRKSNVVAKEFGGITQHIGAFSVTMLSGDVITFLDTPGHAAFTAMRGRGAQVTDIIVLVVAAEDGVMQQTQESIRHAQDADVPIIVAINKIDKFEAQIDKTKNMLLSCGVMLEEDGGNVPVVPISALKGTNLDQLQETIITVAEMLELRGDPKGKVEGAIIEAKTDTQKGRVSTVLVQRGTLKKGMCLVAGTAWAKVRNLYDDRGKPQTSVSPGQAAEVTGWKVLPSAGDQVAQVQSESQAREVLRARELETKKQLALQELEVIQEKHAAHQKEYEQLRQEKLDRGRRRGAIFRRIRTKEALETDHGAELSVIIKGDVDGSVEAILNVLASYDSPLCQLNILQHGVGAATEQDVDMAASFDGKIFQFNVEASAKVNALASEQNVEMYNHNVIYKLIDDLRNLLNERVPVMEEEQIIGEADVIQNFNITVGKTKKQVAGCRCTKGELQKSKMFKLVRDGDVILEGSLSSLHHYKEEVNSIRETQECGLVFTDSSVNPEAFDKIICYDLIKCKPEVDWDLNF